MSGREATNALLAALVYGGYQYAYPHKTAYRRLPRPVPLREAWARERKDALFLYLHVPFCEMRCGFCNLFTLTRNGELATPYLDALARQAESVAAALGDFGIARMAIGGGTPTFLAPHQLDRLFDIAATRFGARPTQAPASVETSPATATPERLAVLAAHGVSRVSIGVESFRDEETKAMGRPQSRRAVEAALGAIRDAAIATLNIDLIYGAAGQTPASFLESIEAALAWRPEELYLYPLYVRPLTGLGKRATRDASDWDAQRLAIYRTARDRLLEEGYEQISMRMFSRGRESHPTSASQEPLLSPPPCGEGPGVGVRAASAIEPNAAASSGRREPPSLALPHKGEGKPLAPHHLTPVVTNGREIGQPYSCTRDGMVGLGAGARSYTSELHYSSEYAVGQAGVKAIIEDFCVRDAAGFACADYGIRLDGEDRRRRFVLMSLLQAEGLSLCAYEAAFDASAVADLPQLIDLEEAGLAVRSADRLALTAAGLERSDAIGPWLQAAGIRARMRSFALR